jgi:tRNA A37 N6-isopentenylltransferase MiaA
LPNLDPWINQNEEHIITKTITNKFENDLLSIKIERQKMIHPNSHPTYNERHEKIIELIDLTLEKHKEATTVTNRQNNQQTEEAIIIDYIIEELDKKRDTSINKKNKDLLKDEVSVYRLEENTLDYILFIIRELTGKLY